MIIINKNNTNNIVITCSELMSNPNNFIAIEFINETTFDKVYVLLTNNLSPSIGRYDEYEITETEINSVDPENGIINLPLLGHWQYNCYEYNANEPWDPELVTSGKLVETGRCLVNGELLGLDEVYK